MPSQATESRRGGGLGPGPDESCSQGADAARCRRRISRRGGPLGARPRALCTADQPGDAWEELRTRRPESPATRNRSRQKLV
jgi:hypothetical protein